MSVELSPIGKTPATATLVAQIAAIVSVQLGAIVLLGWSFDIALMRSVLPGAVEMKANTAIALCLSGLALLIFVRADQPAWLRAGQLLALSVAAIGFATMSQYLFGWNLAIDELVVRDNANAFNVIRGRMSPYSTVAFAAIGLALAGLPLRSRRWTTVVAASVTTVIGAISLLGYLWNAAEIVTDRWLPPVAVNTAVAFILLGVGTTLLSRARRPDVAMRATVLAPLETKILYGFSSGLVLLIAAGAITNRAGVAADEAAQLVARTQATRLALANLYAAVLAAESGQRGYLLARTAQRKSDLSQGIAGTELRLQELAQAVGSDLAEARDFAELRRAVGLRIDALVRVAAVYERAGLQAAREAIIEEHSIEAMQTVREATTRMTAALDRVLAHWQEMAMRARAITLVAQALTLALAIGGIILLFRSVRREMAARLAAEAALRSANEDLEKVVADMLAAREEILKLNEALQVRALQLEEASKTKSEFLATMSHELRTPLNAIIGFSEALRDGLLGTIPAAQLACIDDIHASGEHLLSLINDILDLSKVEAGHATLEAEWVQLKPLLSSALSIVRERAHSRRLKLAAELADDLSAAWVDERKLKQIVYNLLSNAVKFTPEGGHVTLRAMRLAGADADELEISVIDTGIGIAAEDQALLFKPFVQLDGSLARSFQGTGLGLALVKAMAELHGGSVSVRSARGEGSTFAVRLPYFGAHTGAPTRRHPTPAAPRAARNRPLALVVEDESRAAELLRIQLDSAGLEVLTAADAERGLVLAREHRPDLITLDLMLPGMDGTDFLVAVKSDAQLAAIPVIVISIAGETQRAAALGAATVLQKPVDRQALNRAIESLGFAARPLPDGTAARTERNQGESLVDEGAGAP